MVVWTYSSANQPPNTHGDIPRAFQNTLKTPYLEGGWTQWISARATRPGQCPCFTRLFDRYQIGLIRRGLPEIDDFVAHAWAVGPTNVTAVENPTQCGSCPVFVDRRFGMRIHRVTHGMQCDKKPSAVVGFFPGGRPTPPPEAIAARGNTCYHSDRCAKV